MLLCICLGKERQRTSKCGQKKISGKQGAAECVSNNRILTSSFTVQTHGNSNPLYTIIHNKRNPLYIINKNQSKFQYNLVYHAMIFMFSIFFVTLKSKCPIILEMFLGVITMCTCIHFHFFFILIRTTFMMSMLT